MSTYICVTQAIYYLSSEIEPFNKFMNFGLSYS